MTIDRKTPLWCVVLALFAMESISPTDQVGHILQLFLQINIVVN